MAFNVDLYTKVGDLIKQNGIERVMLALSVCCEENAKGEKEEVWRNAAKICVTARNALLCQLSPVGRGKNGPENSGAF